MVLVAGALLAAGLPASLVAGRLRVPSLLLFLGLGMAARLGRPRLDSTSTTTSSPGRSGSSRWRSSCSRAASPPAGSEIRPVFVPALSLASVGTLITAIIAGFAASLAVRHRRCSGAADRRRSSPATDGAAIFAVLRGSTLRRRLARTLEGEAGMNDPVAVLLVIGFIDWIQQPDYGVCDMLVLFVAASSSIGAAVGIARRLGAAWALRQVQPRVRRPVPGGVAGVRRAGVRRRRRPARLRASSPSTSRASSIGSAAIAGAADDHDVPRRARVGRAARACSSSLGLLVFPSDSAACGSRAPCSRSSLVFVARPIAVVRRARVGRLLAARARRARAGPGLRGAVPVVLATFPVIAGVDGAASSSSTSCSSPCSCRRCCRARRSSGSRRGSASRRTRRRSRRRSSTRRPRAGWARRSPSSRCAAGDAVGRAAGPRARPAARGAAQRDHPRRAGDPAARLDAHRGRRPAARARPPGGRDRVPRRCSRAGARARSGRRRAGRAAARTRPIFTSAPVGRRPTATPRARARRRHRGRRPAAHAPRPARARSSRSRTAATPYTGPVVAVGPTRRCRTSRGAGCSAPRRRRARVVAGGHRRAGAALNAQTCVGGLRSRRAPHPARGPSRCPRGRTRIRCAGRADGADRGRDAQARDLPRRASGCRSAIGRVVLVESVDPDGDGDLHVVVVGRDSVTAPGFTAVDVRRGLRPRRDPKVGQLVTAAGQVQRGSYGQRQIHAVSFRVG